MVFWPRKSSPTSDIVHSVCPRCRVLSFHMRGFLQTRLSTLNYRFPSRVPAWERALGVRLTECGINDTWTEIGFRKLVHTKVRPLAFGDYKYHPLNLNFKGYKGNAHLWVYLYHGLSKFDIYGRLRITNLAPFFRRFSNIQAINVLTVL